MRRLREGFFGVAMFTTRCKKHWIAYGISRRLWNYAPNIASAMFWNFRELKHLGTGQTGHRIGSDSYMDAYWFIV